MVEAMEPSESSFKSHQATGEQPTAPVAATTLPSRSELPPKEPRRQSIVHEATAYAATHPKKAAGGLLVFYFVARSWRFFGSLIFIVVGAVGLSALPRFRYVVDGFLVGQFQSPEERIASAFSSSLNRSRDSLPDPCAERAPSRQDVSAPSLSAVPEPLRSSFLSAVDLVVRDFILFWYLNPAVSTGEMAFPSHVRSLLLSAVAKGHSIVSGKSPRDLFDYLTATFSTTLIRELRTAASPQDLAAARTPEAKNRRTERRLRTQKAVAEEVVYALLPQNVTNSPAARELLKEILAVQLGAVAQGIDEDFINRSIVQYLGPSGVAADKPTNQEQEGPKAVKGGSDMQDVVKQAVEEVGQATKQAVKQTTAAAAVEPPILMRGVASYTCQPLLYPLDTAEGVLKTYSALAADPARSADLDRVLRELVCVPPPTRSAHADATALRSILTTSASGSADSALTDALQVFLESHPAEESLVGLFRQIVHFERVLDLLQPTGQLLKQDSLAVLNKTQETLSLYRAMKLEGYGERQDGLWRVVVQVVRELERAQEASGAKNTFESLKAWIANELEQGPVGAFVRQQAMSLAMEDPLAVPARSTFFAAMSIPHVPPSTAAEAVTPPASLSLAGLSFGRPLTDTGPSGTTRKRSSSFSRTAASPPGSEWGSPLHRPSSDSYLHSPRDGTIPEEGDVAEGYCLDDEEHGRPAGQRTAPVPHSQSGPPSPSPAPPEGSEGLPQPPPSVTAMSVNVMDSSPATAWDAKGMVRSKKDLEFMIAVEASGVPGYIVYRKWPEVEKLDAEVHKIVSSYPSFGTVEFPRALLPSQLQYKTSDGLCANLQSYLGSLLKEHRYASTAPAVQFFARERAGSAQGNKLFSPIGKGVTNLGNAVGKEVNKGLAMPANLATQGFNQLSKGFSGLPFGAKRRASTSISSPTAPANDGATKSRAPRPNSLSRAPSASNLSAAGKALSQPTPSPAESTNPPALASRSSLSLAESAESTSCIPQASLAAPAAYEGNPPDASARKVLDVPLIPVQTCPVGPRTGSAPSASPSPLPSIAELPAVDPREDADGSDPPPEPATGVDAAHGSDDARAPDATPPDPLVQVRPVADAPLDADPRRRSADAPGPARKSGDAAGASPKPPPEGLIDQQGFDGIITAIMSIFEAAYGLSKEEWSIRRGVFRLLETYLRTASGPAIKDAINKVLGSSSDPAELARLLDGQVEAFWPGGRWWSAPGQALPPERTRDQKDATREQARKLFVEAFAPLKPALGGPATVQAANQFFDVLQGEGALVLAHALVLDVFRILLLL